MSEPQTVSGRAIASPPTALALSEEDPAVIEAGFDPEHVGHQSVICSRMDENGHPTSQTFGLFIAQDETGRAALDAAGYHRIEIASRPDQPVKVGYLSPEQYTEYVAFQERRMEGHIRDAADRLDELTGPRRRRGLRDAEAAIVPAKLFTGERVDPQNPCQMVEGPAFDAQTIDPNVTGRVRQDAEAVLRGRGLVPHRIEGDPTEYWMTPTQWAAYDRAAETTGAPRIYHD